MIGTAAGCRLLSRGVFAVVASHTVATINTLRSFSGAFRLPFVSTGLPVTGPRSRRRRRHGHRGGSDDLLDEFDDNDDDDDEVVVNYDVYMRPLYSRAVVDLLKHYHSHQVWYLYNSNEGPHIHKPYVHSACINICFRYPQDPRTRKMNEKSA